MAIARHKQKIHAIAVLTSGGDAPGMNAAIRAVVRSALAKGVRVFGAVRGYRGVIDGNWKEMDARSVANTLQRGGTILKTDRCEDFFKRNIRKKAVADMRALGIDALVVIGGDGSFRGAHALWTEDKFPVAGIPGTIDNDVAGTETTIGFDTAVNTALDAIDKIRDTASSHSRTFVVEVMGRNTGYIALDVGVGGGAEVIGVPEWKITPADIAKKVREGMKRGKTSSIIVVAEGAKSGSSFKLAETLEKKYKISAKVCVLGHTQRGGSPSARDRKIASLMGAEAVFGLLGGNADFMTGLKGEEVVFVPLQNAIKKESKIPRHWEELASILAI